MLLAGGDYRHAPDKLEQGQTFARRSRGNPHVPGFFMETPPQTAATHNRPLIGSDTSILKNFPKLI
jgi:hypothetical protein